MIVKNIEKKENNTATFQVEADAKEFEAAVNGAYLKSKKDIYIPGFRKGKAPRAVIEGMYGAECFYQDAMDELAPKAFDLGITDGGLNVVGAPAILDVKVTEEKGVLYTFSADIYPVVTLGEYKGLEAPYSVAEVTDEQISEEIEAARKRNARKVSVDDRAAAMGDTANIDFDGYLNGERFDGGKGENYDLVLGSGSFVPGFEEQVVGMTIGEEKDLDITFPEQYAEGLAGKAVVFKVKLNSLTVDELPELDDDFAGDNGFDTLDEFKADLRTKAEEKAAEAAQKEFENELVKMAVDNMTVTVPQSMTQAKAEEILRNYAANFGLSDPSITYEKLVEMLGVNEETMNNNIRPAAEFQVKTELLFGEIIKAENIETTEDEVSEYIEKMAASFNATAEQLKQYFGDEFITEELKKEKAGKVIFESAVKKAE